MADSMHPSSQATPVPSKSGVTQVACRVTKFHENLKDDDRKNAVLHKFPEAPTTNEINRGPETPSLDIAEAKPSLIADQAEVAKLSEYGLEISQDPQVPQNAQRPHRPPEFHPVNLMTPRPRDYIGEKKRPLLSKRRNFCIILFLMTMLMAIIGIIITVKMVTSKKNGKGTTRSRHR